ncbi:MAG TPA: hypothetical protein VGO47_10145, partial [Chlamydiales bacterium]|nr:hypothetical protein [Chlamydiales bacterium]
NANQSDDTDCDDDADTRGKAAELFFAPSSSPKVSANLKPRSPSLRADSPSISGNSFHTPLGKSGPPQGGDAMTTPSPPDHSRPFRLPIASTSTPCPFRQQNVEQSDSHWNILLSDLKQLSSPMHPIFGFKKRSTPLSKMTPFDGSVLGSPCRIPSTSPDKVIRIQNGLPLFAFASPSVSPSVSHRSPFPHRETPKALSNNLKLSSPFRPSHAEKTDLPPFIDLEKMLKRKLSRSSSSRNLAKKLKISHSGDLCPPSSRPSSSIIPPNSDVNLKNKDTTNLSLSALAPLPPLKVELPGLPTKQRGLERPKESSSKIDDSPLGHRQRDKQRRALAKAKQVELTAKLVRALPHDMVSSSAREKVQKRERQLAELRVHLDAEIAAKRQSTYCCRVQEHNDICDATPNSGPGQ